ncbi:LOW QUALITY PROTEIN: olfactory receptor 14C36-like [Cavia porcellus]|uniref:LOW QUALITY PROTEIN: olfactory receptor 14C36-like n=1 Tax=Cavia porcellus TaxID=10141 RepID=UPI002FE05BDF
MSNSTTMMDFLLMELSNMQDRQVFHAMFSSMIYLVTVMGNLIIAVVITFDQILHTPMYFFLRNLPMLDSCYFSVMSVPNSYIKSLLDSSSILKAGCAAQVFLVAHDHFAAICKVVHYPSLKNPRMCVHSTLASLLSGLVYAALHTSNTFWLSSCDSHAVQKLFRDIPSLLKLSCSDTFSNWITILVAILVFVGGCFIFIIKSYIQIFPTVLRLPAGADRTKAFSTCVPHILVVGIFISGSYVYLSPPATSACILDIFLSVFYSVSTPHLNLAIYSLRNQQITCTLRKFMTRLFFTGNVLRVKEAFPTQLNHSPVVGNHCR